ncbi:MAG: Fic family protein [Nitriliruptoraceae bacterium]
MRYRPAIPPLIGALDPPLSPGTRAAVEEATLRLRSVDAAGATGPAAVALLRTESSASSKIEQIEVGQRYIGRALAGLPTQQRSAQEVAGNVAALQGALAGATSDIGRGYLDDIHAALLPGEPWAGSVREVQNWIGGSDHSPRDARFVPPGPERVPALLADLITFIRRTDLPALVQAAIAHAQFEIIHPYADGNGRVGRALVHVILRRRGIVVNGVAPLSSALLAEGNRYFDDLRRYEQGDVDGFVVRFARSGLLAADAAGRLAGQLDRLRAEWRELDVVARARSDATVRRLIEDLVEHPVCSAGQVADRHGVSHEAARMALDALAEAGVLNRTIAARNLHVFEADEVFALLEDVERWMERAVT